MRSVGSSTVVKFKVSSGPIVPLGHHLLAEHSSAVPAPQSQFWGVTRWGPPNQAGLCPAAQHPERGAPGRAGPHV